MLAKSQDTQELLSDISTTLSTCITELTNGYISESRISDKGASVDIKTPITISTESLLPVINNFLRQSGFEIISPWSKFRDGGIRCAQSLHGIFILFNYDEKEHIFSFIIPIPD